MLATLEINPYPDVSSTAQISPINLPMVSMLHVALTENGARWDQQAPSIEPFLAALHMPMLRDLRLFFLVRDDRWKLLVSEFWERHASQLRTFGGALSTDDDLRSLFRTMPNLTSFQLSSHGVRMAAPEFDALREEQLLPALTHLDVAVGYRPGVEPIESVHAAIALLRARTVLYKDMGVARLLQATFDDVTHLGVNGIRPFSREIYRMMRAAELDHLRELKTGHGIDVWWEIDEDAELASTLRRMRLSRVTERTERSSSSPDFVSSLISYESSLVSSI